MKKLLLCILIPVLVVGGGAATVYFLLRDTSTMQYQKTEKTAETLMNENFLSAFNDTKESHHVTYEMSQDDFNQVLSLAYEKMDSSMKDYLKGMEIKIEGDLYHICLYAKASILQSKVDLSCRFSSDEENYYLTIESIKVGKLSGMKWLAKQILKNVFTDEQMNSMFRNYGIQMKADLNNDRFVYGKNDCRNDLVGLVKKNSGTSSFMNCMIQSFVDMDLLSVDFTNKMQAIIDLEPLNTNASFCNAENELDSGVLNLDVQKGYVKTLLENGSIDLESSHPQIVFDYLLKGYSSLADEQKSYIDSVDLTSIGISEETKKTHAGFGFSGQSVRQIVQSSALNSSLVSSDGILVSENSLNLYLWSQDILGNNYILSGKKDDSYIVNYIALDNVYIDCLGMDSKENMNMVLGVNVNGYETSIILENRKKENTDYGMTLQNENIYFGTKTISSELKKEIYSLIQKCLPENEFMTFDGNGTFTLDFKDYLSDYLSLISSTTHKTLTLNTSLEGNSLVDTNAGLRLKGNLV